MAARLTDKQKKKIIADYVECGSYNATAKMNGVTHQTVKRVVSKSTEITKKVQQKKRQNTLDMLAYMESRKKQAQEVIDSYIKALADPEKIDVAKLSEIATAMGIVIDKFVNTPAKHQLDKQKLEIELLKLESQLKDSQLEEEAEDNFMEAMNAQAAEVWEEGEEKDNEIN